MVTLARLPFCVPENLEAAFNPEENKIRIEMERVTYRVGLTWGAGLMLQGADWWNTPEFSASVHPSCPGGTLQLTGSKFTLTMIQKG